MTDPSLTPPAADLAAREKRIVQIAILGPVFMASLAYTILQVIPSGSSDLQVEYLPIHNRFTCTVAGFDLSTCDDLLADTRALHETIAPTFAGQAACETDAANCIETDPPRTPVAFTPIMNGVLLLTRGSGTRSLPVWFDRAGNFYVGTARFANYPGSVTPNGGGLRCADGTPAGFLGLCGSDAARVMIDAIADVIRYDRPSGNIPSAQRLTGAKALAPKTVAYVKRGGFGQSAGQFALSSKS